MASTLLQHAAYDKSERSPEHQCPYVVLRDEQCLSCDMAAPLARRMAGGHLWLASVAQNPASEPCTAYVPTVERPPRSNPDSVTGVTSSTHGECGNLQMTQGGNQLRVGARRLCVAG